MNLSIILNYALHILRPRRVCPSGQGVGLKIQCTQVLVGSNPTARIFIFILFFTHFIRFRFYKVSYDMNYENLIFCEILWRKQNRPTFWFWCKICIAHHFPFHIFDFIFQYLDLFVSSHQFQLLGLNQSFLLGKLSLKKEEDITKYLEPYPRN